MTTVKIIETPGCEWVDVVSRYDPEVVSTIKEISPNYREWVPDKKHWRVLADYGPQLTEALIARGHDVVGDEPPAPIPEIDAFFGVKPATEDVDAKAIAEEFWTTVPEPNRHKVFRALARALYPDLYKR